MKPLPKHPKQQRMEDMTFPLQKGDYTGGVHKKRSGNTLKPSDFSSDRYEDITFPLHKPGKCFYHPREPAVLQSGTAAYNLCQKCLDKNLFCDSKVTWEGREWLRSINDDRHGWHVLAWVILGVAVIISLKIVL